MLSRFQREPIMPFARLVHSILKELKDPGRPGGNCRIRDKPRLAIDLALVGCCLRTAYLVDAFTPPDRVSFWHELLQKLRSSALTSVAFASAVHIFEPCSEQSFIVNVSMIPHLLSGLSMELSKRQEDHSYPVFVQISQHPTFQLLDAVPVPLFRLLDSLNQALSPGVANPEIYPLTHVLPGLPSSLSIPLAAILLDFSVGYVPELEISAESAPWSGISMHFFECILSFREVEENDEAQSSSSHIPEKIDPGNVKSCTVMKFSCPASHKITLQPEKIIAHLENLITERMVSTSDPTLLNVEIRQTTHTVDRLLL